MQQIYIDSYFRSGYTRFMNYISNISTHPDKKIIEERLRILEFFDEFGATATRRAFNKSRSTLFLWKKNLKEDGGRLSALAPKKTKPKHFRQSLISPSINHFIKDYRLVHPGVGKETIKAELDHYCDKEGLPLISESTIGRIVKDLKEHSLIPITNKLSYYAKSESFKERLVQKKKKLRRKGYTPAYPGDLVQIDSIVIFTNGLKRYLVTAIDVKSRFAFALAYNNHSSLSARDFMTKLREVAPFPIRRVQTDNGSEFHQCFREYLEDEDITQFFNYPRRPKSNAYIERFNRTIQEQYVSWHLSELEDINNFNHNLMEYLLWYNTIRPHKSLQKIPPLKYFIDNFITNTQKSNMLWTLTMI